MAIYMLVHGAWHGGWCWQRVTPFLRGRGHDVLTPTLTGLGERAHLATPEIDLNTHVQDIIGVLEYEDLHQVILVGHSYAGMVITAVAERVADRLAHLVYLDAFVPQYGQSLADLVPPAAVTSLQEQAQAQGAGWRLPPFPLEQYGVTLDADKRWVGPKLVFHPFKTILQPVQRSSAAVGALPRTYIYCHDPAMGFFEQFAERARTEQGWRYRELATGHDAMVTAPRQVADLLLELA